MKTRTFILNYLGVPLMTSIFFLVRPTKPFDLLTFVAGVFGMTTSLMFFGFVVGGIVWGCQKLNKSEKTSFRITAVITTVMITTLNLFHKYVAPIIWN